MKSWYINRVESGVNHKGATIPKGKKIYLTEAQAGIHNGKDPKVEKSEPPKDITEVAVAAEYEEYTEAVKAAKAESQKGKRG